MNSAGRILTLANLVLASGPRCRAQSVADILERVRAAVLTITTNDAKGKSNGLASGFAVRQDGVVLTAWHVVSDAATVRIKMQDGNEYAVKGVLAKGSTACGCSSTHQGG